MIITIIILDLILIVLLFLVIPFYILNIFNILTITVSSKSIANELVIISQIILIILSSVLIIYLIKLINNNEIKTLSKKIINFFYNNKILTTTLIVFILLFTTFFILIINQKKLIYIPNHNKKYHQEILKNDKLEVVNIKDNEFEYIGYLKNDLVNKPIIIYYGGNADSAASIFHKFSEIENSLLNNFNFIMIDYPKYGLSTNNLSQDNIFKMALLTFDYVVNELNYSNNNIIVMGYSLGSGVASYVASKRATKTNVLIAPYNSILNVANTLLPIFYGPFKALIKDHYNSYQYVEDINVKTLIIASKKDKVIKYKLTERLIENIDNYELALFNDLSHNDFLEKDYIHQEISEFILGE